MGPLVHEGPAPTLAGIAHPLQDGGVEQGEGVGVAPAGEGEAPQLVALHPALDLLVHGVEAQVVGLVVEDPGALHGLHDAVAVGQGGGHRLLHHDVLPGPGGGDGERGVGVVGGADGDRLHVRPGQDALQGRLEGDAEGGARRLAPLGLLVPGADEAHPGVLTEDAGPAPLVAVGEAEQGDSRDLCRVC